MAGEFRILEDVLKGIELAKLNELDLQNVSQTVWISSDMGAENIKLIELNDKLINDLQQGKDLVIRGATTDFAVLCSDEETYEIKEAETSNSLLLVPELKFPVENLNGNKRELHNTNIIDIHHNYLELRACNPRLKKLEQLLLINPYCGREYELNEDAEKLTFEDLLENVQCSSNELKKALKDMKAYEIDGYWRVLELNYEHRVIEHILNLKEENSWSMNELRLSIILDVLEELEPREILKQCLELYADQVNDGVYSLKEKEICVHYAEHILQTAGKFNLDEFLTSWSAGLPEGFIPSIDFLKGIALIDTESKPKVLSLFNKNNLPEDITERFKVLFKKRTNWIFDDIEPYIRDLTTSKIDANTLLMKYTRSFQKNGVRYYNSKQLKI